MIKKFKDSGGVTPGEILEFLGDAADKGDGAVVPATAVHLFSRCPVCVSDDGFYVFRSPSADVCRCGWSERLCALCVLLIAAPLLLLLALLVLLADGLPVFFRQERYGCGGRPFTLVKFRTMIRASEKLHPELQNGSESNGRLFKLQSDPRVTRTGRYLRRVFLDELPQLWNVVRGEMRFVGPRPLPASDQGHYTKPCHALRLKGAPGITGLWQISGRNALTFDEMCLLDYYYLCNRTLRLDLRICWQTVLEVYEESGLKRKTKRSREQPGAV
ncbi:MAG: sugar transferase [Kiritimatiellae bacterium]|nr:sugar transferase [Kiritimatiellia bacterium]